MTHRAWSIALHRQSGQPQSYSKPRQAGQDNSRQLVDAHDKLTSTNTRWLRRRKREPGARCGYKTLTCYHLVVVSDFHLPSGLRFGRGVRLREVAQRLVKSLPAHSDSAIGLQRDALFVDKARADKPVLFGSLELLELCPQGAEGSGGEH